VFQTAVRAGVPIEVKSKSPDASGLPANSMDAVVSVYAMSELSDSQVASSLSEAVRVLKPGKPFIFVENVGAKATVLRAAQGALETIGRMMGNKTCATRDLLPFLEVCCAFSTHLQISWLRNTQKLNHFWQPVWGWSVAVSKGITHRCNKQFGFQILWILIWKHISSSRKVMNLLFWKQKVEGLTDLQYDNLLDFQDPHLVGVAIKKPAVSASESSDARDKLTKKKRKSQPAVNTA
jgi:SAM-dependent methyltransferase